MPYHIFVAKRTTRNVNNKKSRAIVVFWLAFIIIIICIYMANAETIKKNFDFFKNRISKIADTEEELLIYDDDDEQAITVTIDKPAQTQTTTQTPAQTQTTTQTSTQTAPAAQTSTTPAAQTAPAATQTPAATPAAQTPSTTQTSVQTRDRSIYFVQVNSDGQINHFKVTRKIKVSESPMMDVLNILLTGPTADEIRRGILNLIPQNTRILSATVRGNTAYINFSEDFLFNTYGVEGYVAQLRQIVWTVTEFQNVNDVQILIEGRRLDYLGEGIWIGSPINRQSF